jgi:outer membrane protein OmpA-like peptidoglycan-associated protein
MKQLLLTFATVALAATASGCAHRNRQQTGASEVALAADPGPTVGEALGDGATSGPDVPIQPIDPAQGQEEDPVPVVQAPCALEPVYFEFDSDEVAFSDRRRIDAFARCLLDHHVMAVGIEGWADPTGGVQYNLGLSGRRAEAVRRLLRASLASRGVREFRIDTVPFGADASVVGQGEDAYRRARRAATALAGQKLSNGIVACRP